VAARGACAAGGHDIDAAFASMVENRIGAVLVSPDTFYQSRRDQIVARAARGRTADQRRETGRTAGPAGHESRTDHQSLSASKFRPRSSPAPTR
jgi:hypothetical protein